MKHLFFLVFLLISFNSSGEVLLYSGKPIHIELPQSRDVLLKFNEPQRVGTSSHVKSKISLKPNGNYVSLNSSVDSGVFEIVFQGLKSGKVVYIKAHPKSRTNDYRDELTIKFPDEINIKNQDVEPKSSFTPREVVASLARSIAQKYGKKEFIEDGLFSIRKLKSSYEQKSIPGLYKQSGVTVTPLDTYFGKGIYGTTFLVQNHLSKNLVIEPSKFRGNWIAIDLKASKTSLRQNEKAIITLFHTKKLPNNVNDIVYGAMFR